ncbi:MAG TPA: hypothetical protein VGQ27_04605 [Steroidobacteraceae bacterium]|nr:hypothetical protein [Steroidobacteraceae bacterium]
MVVARAACLVLAWCAPALTLGAIADTPGIPQVRVDVTRDGNVWHADFSFDRSVATWVFPRSDVTREGHKPWRPASWSVETRGVQLQRRGSYDAFVAERGDLPRRVRVRLTPRPEGLQADYAPALLFTDGSVALYVAQFGGFPMDSSAAVNQLPSDLNNQRLPAAQLLYFFHDSSGPVLLDGNRVRDAQTRNPDTYVVFGALRPIETPDMVGIVDPQLPAWIRELIERAVPALFSRYTQELGRLPDLKPTLLVNWSGPTPGIVSRAGSALHGLIAMTYEGSGMIEETRAQRDQSLWFIAHESAHFWLGQTVAYQYARDAWITEGGADLLAVRAVADTDPDYDPAPLLNQAIEDCIRLAHRGIASARDRGEHRAYYACGAVFGLIAEAGSGRSFYRFARRLIDANRTKGMVTRADWLNLLDDATRKPELRRGIEQLLDRGAAEPAAFITDLLEHADLSFEVDASGIPRLPSRQ